MIWGEKLLRKLRFSWDLCSSAAEAQNLKQVAERASIEKGERKAAYDVVLVADSLALSDAGPLQRLFKQGDGDALVVGLAALKGPDGALALSKARFNSKSRGLTKDVEAVLPSHVASICDLAMTKPLKGVGLSRICSRCLGKGGRLRRIVMARHRKILDYRGLTTKSPMRKCYALQAGQSGRTISDPSKQKKRKKAAVSTVAPRAPRRTFPAPPLDQKIEPLIDLTFPVAGHTTLPPKGLYGCFGGVGGAFVASAAWGTAAPRFDFDLGPLYCPVRYVCCADAVGSPQARLGRRACLAARDLCVSRRRLNAAVKRASAPVARASKRLIHISREVLRSVFERCETPRHRLCTGCTRLYSARGAHR